MKRVLLIVSEFPPVTGGIAVHAQQLANNLVILGHQVKVVTFQQQALSGQSYEVVPAHPASFSLLTFIHRFRVCFKQSRGFDPDVVLLSNKFPLWVGWLLSFFYKRPQYIVILHGNELLQPNRFLNWVTRKALNRMLKLVAVSSYTRLLLDAEQQKKCVVIHNGVGEQWFGKLTAAKTFSGKLKLLTVGTVRKRKGHQHVIRALPAVLKKYPQMHYIICGRQLYPAYVRELEELAIAHGVADKITFLYIPFEDNSSLKNLYRESDICMLLSETQPDGDTEGYGISIQEANAMGTPAIGALGCGIEDAITPKENGELVHPGNEQELLLAIDRIVLAYPDYSVKSFNRAQRNTSFAMAEKYETLFSDR